MEKLKLGDKFNDGGFTYEVIGFVDDGPVSKKIGKVEETVVEEPKRRRKKSDAEAQE